MKYFNYFFKSNEKIPAFKYKYSEKTDKLTENKNDILEYKKNIKLANDNNFYENITDKNILKKEELDKKEQLKKEEKKEREEREERDKLEKEKKEHEETDNIKKIYQNKIDTNKKIDYFNKIFSNVTNNNMLDKKNINKILNNVNKDNTNVEYLNESSVNEYLNKTDNYNDESEEYLNDSSNEYLNDSSNEYLNDTSKEYLNDDTSKEYLNDTSTDEYINNSDKVYKYNQESSEPKIIESKIIEPKIIESKIIIEPKIIESKIIDNNELIDKDEILIENDKNIRGIINEWKDKKGKLNFKGKLLFFVNIIINNKYDDIVLFLMDNSIGYKDKTIFLYAICFLDNVEMYTFILSLGIEFTEGAKVFVLSNNYQTTNILNIVDKNLLKYEDLKGSINNLNGFKMIANKINYTKKEKYDLLNYLNELKNKDPKNNKILEEIKIIQQKRYI